MRRGRNRIVRVGRRLAPGALALLLALAAKPIRSDPALAAAQTTDRFDTVVIDAGHGGDDLGAQGPTGVVEKELVLDVARRLKRRLEREGLRVVLTRFNDAFVPLEQRTAIANDARGDLFLSIHANGARARSARGVETFFLSLEASDDAAHQLARSENAAFGAAAIAASSGDDPLVSILGDMIANEQMLESDEFARIAQREVAALDRAPSRGVKQAPFVVLMGVQMPASLVEIGFLTNPDDERALRGPERREHIAEALGRAVREFGGRYDARRGVQRRGAR